MSLKFEYFFHWGKIGGESRISRVIGSYRLAVNTITCNQHGCLHSMSSTINHLHSLLKCTF